MTNSPAEQWPEQARALVQRLFGFEALKPHQEEVLRHIWSGRDTLAILPTGSGKTLCYTVPALLRDGLVLVVSPLIALIRDQVERLGKAGIACVALDSQQSLDEKDDVWRRLGAGAIKLLFVSPERLARPAFRERLKLLPLQMVAVDEAHCISHIGQHFRPDYRLLGEYLADLQENEKRPQILALTATAPTRVRADITTALRLDEPATVWADFARDNLEIKVIKASKVAEQLTFVLQAVQQSLTKGDERKGSGIVYVPTRKQTHEIQRLLTNAGISAVPYHAGLSAAERHRNQQAFMSNRVCVIVATHAFGMGIDKPDIRFVHHAGMPTSLEHYVQEIGRAGRDGLPASCWLIYSSRDYHIQKYMLDKSLPDPERLRLICRSAHTFLERQPLMSEDGLLRHLASDLTESRMKTDELREALSILYREGLLTPLRSGASAYGEGRAGGSDREPWDEVLVTPDASTDQEAFFQEYPLRKLDILAKLEAMRAYAALSEGRAEFLNEYFRR